MVGAWTREETPEALDDFRAQTGVTFPFAFDENWTLYSIGFDDAGYSPYPRDVLIGKDLTILAIRSEFEPDEWVRLVEEALAKL